MRSMVEEVRSLSASKVPPVRRRSVLLQRGFDAGRHD